MHYPLDWILTFFAKTFLCNLLFNCASDVIVYCFRTLFLIFSREWIKLIETIAKSFYLPLCNYPGARTDEAGAIKLKKLLVLTQNWRLRSMFATIAIKVSNLNILEIGPGLGNNLQTLL